MHNTFDAGLLEIRSPFSLKHYASGLDRKTRFKTSVSNARIPVQISECQGYLGPEVDTDLFLVEKITLSSGVLLQAELIPRSPWLRIERREGAVHAGASLRELLASVMCFAGCMQFVCVHRWLRLNWGEREWRFHQR